MSCTAGSCFKRPGRAVYKRTVSNDGEEAIEVRVRNGKGERVGEAVQVNKLKAISSRVAGRATARGGRAFDAGANKC
jgi:hypothetical protein